MRVLLLADEANPEWVSGPLIGWSLCQAIAAISDAHIVTQVRNRDAFIRAGLSEGSDFTALDTEYIASPLNTISRIVRGGRNFGGTIDTVFRSIAYYAFEANVWRRFGEDIASGVYDLVHRVTPVSPAIASTIGAHCRRAGVPFVIGPLNGGLPWPPGFGARQGREREWLGKLRGMVKLMPGFNSTRRDAAAIIVGAAAARDELAPKFQEKAHLVSENAVDPGRFARRRTRTAGKPLIAVFVGRLVPVKCADILLRAAQEAVRSGDLRLKIIGDGPLRQEYEELAASLNISDGVEFTGWLAHEQLQDQLIEGDVFVLPSVKEFGGGAVLEAMAVGLAPVVADYGGPVELVDHDSGIRVPFDDEDSLQENLCVTLEQLIADPARLDEFGRHAAERVRERYTWSRKAQEIMAVYRNVCANEASVGAAPLRSSSE